MLRRVEASAFDETELFRVIEASGARALLIGRRALISLGLPVLTRDYDFWIHIDDAAKLNVAAAPFDMRPNRSPEEARKHGRYVLENDEKVDVLVAPLGAHGGRRARRLRRSVGAAHRGDPHGVTCTCFSPRSKISS